jgi:hypothetical protein
MTSEEKGAWQQAQREAYALLMSVEAHNAFSASKHLGDLDLLLKHLRQIDAQKQRTGWGDDNG